MPNNTPDLLLATIPLVAPRLSIANALNLSSCCSRFRVAVLSSLTGVGLHLDGNATDSRVAFLCKCSSAEVVKIRGDSKYSNTKLARPDLIRIGSLFSLRQLDLHNCNLERLLPLTALCQLLTLSLDTCTISSLPSPAQLDKVEGGKLNGSAIRFEGGKSNGSTIRVDGPVLRADPFAPLSNLTSLQHMVLRSCFPMLDSTLQFLSALVALESLDLSKCKHITGAGLRHVKNLTALTQLSLEGCTGLGEAGLVQLALLTGLQQLSLQGAVFAPQPLPSQCWQQLSCLQALRHLNFQGCYGTQEAVPYLVQLPHLQHLVVSSLDADALLHLAGMQALVSLKLHNCNVTGEHMSLLAGLPSLQLLGFEGISHQVTNDNVKLLGNSLTCLELSFNSSVTDDGLADLCATATRLRKLLLDGCDFGPGLAHLSLLQSLETLNLWLGRHDDKWVAHLTCLTSLLSLELGCMWAAEDGTGADDELLQSLSVLTRLTHLAVTRSRRVTTAGLKLFTTFSQLRSLSLSGTSITDDALLHLKDLHTLEDLDLSVSDQLQGWGLADLSRLTRLTWLNLATCSALTPEGLAHVTVLTSLKRLSLQRSLQHVPVLLFLSALTSLRHLSVGRKRFLSDTLEPDLHGICVGLPRLEKLQMSRLQPSMDVWVHLPRLRSLRHLKLRDCPGLDDAILSIIAQMTGLEKLTLIDCGNITDAGLAALSAVCMLRRLRLEHFPHITETGLAQLSKLRFCRVRTTTL